MNQGLYKFHLKYSVPPTSPDNSISAFNNVVQNFEFSLHTNVQNMSHSSASTLPCDTVQNVQNENPCYISTLPSCTVQNNVNKNDALWHHRLGHVPFVQMNHISSISNDLSAKMSFISPICPLARQPRLPFSDSSSHSTSLFQLIHVDTWGPYHIQTYSGVKYFLTIVDDYRRATWTHFTFQELFLYPT